MSVARSRSLSPVGLGKSTLFFLWFTTPSQRKAKRIRWATGSSYQLLAELTCEAQSSDPAIKLQTPTCYVMFVFCQLAIYIYRGPIFSVLFWVLFPGIYVLELAGAISACLGCGSGALVACVAFSRDRTIYLEMRLSTVGGVSKLEALCGISLQQNKQTTITWRESTHKSRGANTYLGIEPLNRNWGIPS